MTIVEKIKGKYDSMTDTEKTIARHVLQNTTLFSLKSIGETAGELSISQMSLVRFAKTMGFEGYSQFRKTLQKEEILHSYPSQRLKKLQDSRYFSSIHHLINEEIGNIQDNILGFDENAFQSLVQKIIRADSIFIVGRREQFFLAQILSYRLHSIGLLSNVADWNTRELSDQVNLLGGNTVFIVFDFYPYSKTIFDAFSELENPSSRLVLITDYPSSPLQKKAQDTHYYPSKTGYLMNSLTGSVFWINLLTTELLKALETETIDLLEKRENKKRKTKGGPAHE